MIRFIATERLISIEYGSEWRKYFNGNGSWTGFATKYGLKASIVTTQGEIDVPKLLPKNGPNGTYSQRWMSRAI